MRDKNRREDKEKRDCRRLEGPSAVLYNPEKYRVEHSIHVNIRFRVMSGPMFYLSFQAASAGTWVRVDAVLLEAGRRGPARRVLPGRLLRSHRGGVQHGETSQGRVTAAPHVERHVCCVQRM